MTNDQFTTLTKQIADLSDGLLKLYKHMERRFDEQEVKFNSRLKDTDQKIDRLYGLADTLLKNQEVDQQERLAMNRQLDRHERWHHQAAQKVGLELS